MCRSCIRGSKVVSSQYKFMVYKKLKKQKQNKVFYIDYIRVSRYALLMTNTTTLPIGSTPSFIVFCVFEKHALHHYCIFRLAALPSSSIKQITKLNKQKDSAYLKSSLGQLLDRAIKFSAFSLVL